MSGYRGLWVGASVGGTGLNRLLQGPPSAVVAHDFCFWFGLWYVLRYNAEVRD